MGLNGWGADCAIEDNIRRFDSDQRIDVKLKHPLFSFEPGAQDQEIKAKREEETNQDCQNNNETKEFKELVKTHMEIIRAYLPYKVKSCYNSFHERSSADPI